MVNRHRIRINPTFDWEGNVISHDGQYFYVGPMILFDRSGTREAKNAVQSANSTAGTFGAQGSQINSILTPQLEKQATNPQGFNPTDVNNMLVASQQGAGGATSGITGQAGLQAARTRNVGGFTNALDEAARIKNRQLSQNALGVSNENAQLKQRQQSQAQQELAGLYGTDTSAQLEAMGLVPKDINAQTKSQTVGWEQQLPGQILGDFAKGALGAAR